MHFLMTCYADGSRIRIDLNYDETKSVLYVNNLLEIPLKFNKYKMNNDQLVFFGKELGEMLSK